MTAETSLAQEWGDLPSRILALLLAGPATTDRQDLCERGSQGQVRHLGPSFSVRSAIRGHSLVHRPCSTIEEAKSNQHRWRKRARLERLHHSSVQPAASRRPVGFVTNQASSASETGLCPGPATSQRKRSAETKAAPRTLAKGRMKQHLARRSLSGARCQVTAFIHSRTRGPRLAILWEAVT